MSDNDLFSSDSEYDEIEEPFWKKTNVKAYHLQLDLQKSAFLIDLLEDKYKFELNNDKIIIYKKNNNGIEEIIERDELIYFLHIHLPYMFEDAGYNLYHNNGKNIYNSLNYFKEIDTIHKAIDNMKIYLKCNKEENQEEESEEQNIKPLIKELRTYKGKNENLNMLKPTVL